MNILFVILTCEKYKERIELQKQTWLKYIGEKDNYYTACLLENAEDTYNNVPLKYVSFFKHYKELNNFDWVFFCDDDMLMIGFVPTTCITCKS